MDKGTPFPYIKPEKGTPFPYLEPKKLPPSDGASPLSKL